MSASEQARADAFADAATLRLFMRDGRHFCGLGTCLGWSLSFQDLGHGVRKHLARRWYERAAKSAESAARAAFEYIPGLRGDR
jgi:hypothetical protein